MKAIFSGTSVSSNFGFEAVRGKYMYRTCQAHSQRFAQSAVVHFCQEFDVPIVGGTRLFSTDVVRWLEGPSCSTNSRSRCGSSLIVTLTPIRVGLEIGLA